MGISKSSLPVVPGSVIDILMYQQQESWRKKEAEDPGSAGRHLLKQTLLS
jgi:hypothetical protein